MKRRRRYPGRRRWIWRSLLAAAILVLLAGALLFGWNRFRMDIVLAGEPELVLEYGEEFTDPGASARLKGTVFFTGGWDPGAEITREGTVDPKQLGTQTITYRAEYHGLHASATRTVRVVDSRAPEITLHTDPEKNPEPNRPYEEEGYTAWDNRDGYITHRVVREEHFGYVTYAVLDSSGNPAYARREIPEYDPVPPELTLVGEPEMTIYAGTAFADPGCTALDNVDGDISGLVQVEGQVVWYKKGAYTLTYTVTDTFGNEASAQRTVHVAPRPKTETVSPGDKVIYLTFDDGPGPYTAELLELLESYDVKATFFVTNSGYYDVLRQITEGGHSIGVHTMTHNYHQIYASEEAFFADLYGMQQIIEEQTGVKTWLMRFPGGSSNAVSRFNEGIMTRLTEAVEDAGFHYIDWNVDSDDAGSARKPETVYHNVTTAAADHNVSVVLQHDIHQYSVEAVEQIIVWGLENGYTFLPMQEDSPPMHHRVSN